MDRPITERDLIGKYRVNLPQGAVEFLELLSNGECVQEIYLSDGTMYKARGEWRYENNLKSLSLEGTRMPLKTTTELDPDMAIIHSGNTGWLSVSRSLFGKIQLCFGEDIYCEKQ